MELYCLGDKPWQPCYVLKTDRLTVMLDCALDLTGMLKFLPHSLVYSPHLSSLNKWSPKDATLPSNNMFCENIDHIFVNSIPFMKLPEIGLVDFSMIDVILISNNHAMLALPYITEHLKFKGQVFATEPCLQYSRLLMEELCDYVHQKTITTTSSSLASDNQNLSQLMKFFPSDKSSDDNFSDVWRPLYSIEEAHEALLKVQPVTYLQKILLCGGVEAIPVSSGFCLGSCNWVIKTVHSTICYLSSSSLLTTHPQPLEKSLIKSCDAVIMAGLTEAPSANPDGMLSEMCGRMAHTLHNGGNVLIPCYPSGVLYDLLECIVGFLDGHGFSTTPVYYVSPVAASSLAHANIYAEWLCHDKQSKVYLPEAPFPHDGYIKSGRLKHFTSTHGDLCQQYSTPCVMFTGHPSLRCGGAVHLMEAWRSNPNNAVFFTEPDFDYLHALAPFQPISMKAFYFPVDPRLNFSTANRLLKEIQPRQLIVPEVYISSTQENTLLPEMPCQVIRRCGVVTIATETGAHPAGIDPQLAQQITPKPVAVKTVGGVASLTCLVECRDDHMTLKPHPQPSESAGAKLWGKLSIDKTLQMLKEEYNILDAHAETDGEDQLIRLANNAVIRLSAETTTVQYTNDDAKLRKLVQDCVLRQLVQL
ncbi:integrator complex subunit 9-like [Dysidea avara]|uniref:integrator complex subunit 9-like n=1 Tax=Dysidea avara TaxID=196820 RepID=UPI003333C5D7